MGLSGLEPPTSRLSGVRSNRLSYKPVFVTRILYYPMNTHSSTVFYDFLPDFLPLFHLFVFTLLSANSKRPAFMT